MPPRLKMHIVFFDGAPGLSYSVSVQRRKNTELILCDGRISHDRAIVPIALLIEELGGEVIASRNRAGEWTRKPWRWFNRFKELGADGTF